MKLFRLFRCPTHDERRRLRADVLVKNISDSRDFLRIDIHHYLPTLKNDVFGALAADWVFMRGLQWLSFGRTQQVYGYCDGEML